MNFSVQNQLTYAVAFIGKVLKYGELPSKITDSFLSISRPITDWREHGWEETIAPYIEYFHNMNQTKFCKTQIYENFSFKQESFSIVKFKKHLKQLLCIIVEDSLADSLKETEKLLKDVEHNECTEYEDSEWNTKPTEIQ